MKGRDGNELEPIVTEIDLSMLEVWLDLIDCDKIDAFCISMANVVSAQFFSANPEFTCKNMMVTMVGVKNAHNHPYILMKIRALKVPQRGFLPIGLPAAITQLSFAVMRSDIYVRDTLHTMRILFSGGGYEHQLGWRFKPLPPLKRPDPLYD